MIARALVKAFSGEAERDDWPVISMQQWAWMFEQFGYQGVQYTQSGQAQEQIGAEFRSLAQLAYRTNGVVFACMAVRSMMFSEARFQYQRFDNGRPGDLFGDQSLSLLEDPWPGGTTGDLLARMIQHADLAGNFFGTERNGEVKILRPDWMGILIGSNDQSETEVDPWSPNAELAGYVYTPGGSASNAAPVFFHPNEIAHFAPFPDPMARYRGLSWVSTVVEEIRSDKAATAHKLKFFENAATPNLFVSLKEPDLAKFKGWMEAFKDQHEGVQNAYKTLFLGAGADATVVGSSLEQLEFKVTQGAGETRIAAAAGVPPVIVGLSEGLEAATYSNYELAMRRFADVTMRPLWRNAAGSLANILDVPGGARLWYDDRDIPALAEDQKKQAETLQANAVTIRQLVDAGFKPDDVVAAVLSNDFSKLEHSGLFSVQLQAAGAPRQGLFTGTVVPDKGDQPASEEPGGSQQKAAANGASTGRDLVFAGSREE